MMLKVLTKELLNGYSMKSFLWQVGVLVIAALLIAGGFNSLKEDKHVSTYELVQKYN